MTCVVLLVITVVAWAQVVSSAMTPDPMQGMVMAPTVAEGLAYVAGWAVMMAAMMLPSALPMIGLYAATQRNASPGRRVVSVALFTVVYLGLWALTGVPIYFASVALSADHPGRAGVRQRRGAHRRRDLPGLAAQADVPATLPQPARVPLRTLARGVAGGLAMGWAHALYCLGCCWALMVVLVVVGAMGLPWVLLIAARRRGREAPAGWSWVARATGVVLVLLGLAVAVRPDLAIALRAGGHSM